MKNSIFTRLIALVLCFIMVAGMMTSCLSGPDFNPVNGTTEKTEPQTGTTTTTGGSAETTTTTPTTSTQPEPEEDETTTTTPPATTEPEEDVTTTTPTTTQPEPEEDETTTTTTPPSTEEPKEDEETKEDTNELFSVSTTVSPDAENKVPEGGVNMNGEFASATIPGGVQLEEGATELSLIVSAIVNSGAAVELLDNEVSTSLDVHMAGVAAGNLVPMEVKLLAAAEKGLNSTSIKLYHVDNGETVEMTRVAINEEFTAHNQFKYDPATGDITLYIASFSEIKVVSNTVNPWTGKADHSWYNAEATTLYIANAEQLWSFSQIVGAMAKDSEGNSIAQDSFDGKTVILLSDIDLGDDEANNDEKKIFYPIGYWNNEGTYERKPVEERVEAVSSGFYSFMGTFDGNGHTISNFYQNTWEMKGDHNWYDAVKEQYYRDGMGLFGKIYKGTVKNLTVSNFSSDGEITTTGVIAAYADGATFQNIAIFNCNPRVYNIGNGGIVGCVGWYAKDANLKTTFTNITVDSTNKISALWGTYDAACGGILGQYYPTSGQSSANYPVNGGVHFENCHVSAVMDVNNDVCGNYQYYAYRYTGILIGSVRENVTIDGRVYPDMKGITATGCTVHYGTWNEYYYCELVANTLASYTHDHQFSRLTEINSLNEIKDGETWTKAGNFLLISGDTKTCYHIVKDENGDLKQHLHKDAGEEVVNGETVLKEDKQIVYLPFNNLVTGYGWGVTSMGVKDVEGVTILDNLSGDSYVKFEGADDKPETLESGTTITLGKLFKFVNNGPVLVPGAITVGVTNLDENGNVRAQIGAYTEEWTERTITFTGKGTVQITIQDYYFCVPTTITLTIQCTHTYDNACDADCNKCGAERTPAEHEYDNACDTTCNVCNATRTVGEHKWNIATCACSVCKTPATETRTIYFQNNWLWANVKVSDSTTTVNMTKVENDGVYDIYKITLPENCTVTISDGTTEVNKHTQPINVSDLNNNAMLYMNYTDKDGHHALIDDYTTYKSKYTKVTLQPTGGWKSDNARFAAYVWVSDSNNKWIDMVDVDGDGKYTCWVPNEYKNIKFCRMNPKHLDNRWNTDTDTEETKHVWNDTSDLTVTSDKYYLTSVMNWVTSNDKVFYLKPNSNWTQSSARFAAYFFNNSTNKNEWVGMVDPDFDGVYACVMPTTTTYANIIFCRMNPNNTENRWNKSDNEYNKPMWNQTADLGLNSGNTYTINSGSWNAGTWSTVTKP